jgi:hypothetical protein
LHITAIAGGVKPDLHDHGFPGIKVPFGKLVTCAGTVVGNPGYTEPLVAGIGDGDSELHHCAVHGDPEIIKFGAHLDFRSGKPH